VPRLASFRQQHPQTDIRVDGWGVAIATTPLVKHLLRAGKLVAPLKQRAASARAYYVVVAPQAARRPQVEAFVQWLQAQAANDEARDRGEKRRAAARRRPPRRRPAKTYRPSSPG
jgi:DNA-binding transcriptional LysR family regulator